MVTVGNAGRIWVARIRRLDIGVLWPRQRSGAHGVIAEVAYASGETKK
jgi:hypothetical protein